MSEEARTLRPTPDTRILVMGSDGLLGSALVRRLHAAGCRNICVCGRRRADLRVRSAVDHLLASERPQVLFLAAARVGGIQANKSYAADFMADNLQIQLNVIDSAYRHGVRKLVFFGSNAMYPALATEPIREEALLSGPLEHSTEPYAIAKLAGVKMCQAYRRQYGFDAICVVPTNLYGTHDNFDPEGSHVMAALLRKFYETSCNGSGEVVVWGNGQARREFVYADDLADACLLLMREYHSEEPINVGCGTDISIGELATLIRDTLQMTVNIVFDTHRPQGASSKLLDSSRIRALGWTPKIDLPRGIRLSFQWLIENWESHAARKQRVGTSPGAL